MFAYVFWHTRSEVTSQVVYEHNLLMFYDALGRVDCPGVRQSATFRISSLPWLKEQCGYEDWTVIDGTWVLDDLNTKAIAGPMAAVHSAIAQHMDSGKGGLYYHLSGDLEPHWANRAQWLSRPRGIQFRPALEKIVQGAGKVSVWRRFMVLGPGPEFIIFGLAPLALQTPVGWQMRAVDRTVLAVQCDEPHCLKAAVARDGYSLHERVAGRAYAFALPAFLEEDF
jgi:hypothetical protein